ncbi:hypothetical protein PLICRDRAFT_261819 [Plicaturopsis crispa FD-325 SS-3]|nr:hypothetical protein PLICRDRAFT_261819 [Plicaturopsis crispa FD-325 SS-3]
MGGNVATLLLIVGYIALNIALIFGGPGGTDIDWIAHHCARLTFANLPILIGLTSKNNILSYATGFSYESLNVLHRWCARMIMAFTVIHVAGRVHVNEPTTDVRRAGTGYVRWGIAAFIAFFWLVLFAARPLRSRFYSFFIIQHVVSFLFALAALWAHRPQVAPWLYSGLAVYFADRVVRTARILWHHGPRMLKKERDLKPQALVEAFSPTMLRVTVLTTMTWIPGQHAYLHAPFISAGGHPFSIASIPQPLTQVDDARAPQAHQVMLITVHKGVTKKLYEVAISGSDDDTSAADTIVETKNAVRHKKRWPCKAIYAWTEGPYGNLQHLDYFQTLMLVSGGSGVTFTLPLMLDIVRRARSMHLGHPELSVATSRLTWIWTIREEENIEWIGDQLVEAIALAPPGLLRVRIFVTGKPPPPPQEPVESNSDSMEMVTSYSSDLKTHAIAPSAHNQSRAPSVQPAPAPAPSPPPQEPHFASFPTLPFERGRPDVRALLEEEVAATDFSDWVAVAACGPSKLGADLAGAVSDAISPGKVFRGEHRRNIYFTQEEYGY